MPRRLSALLLLALAGAAPARAQRLTAGTLRGEVLDAESATPLAGATMALTPASPTAVMPPRERSAFLSAARTTTTGTDGRYAFGDLAPGAYVLRVHRMGYRPTTIEVSLAATTDARVSVGLTMAPVLLQATEVRTRPVASRDTAEARRRRELEDARVAAARTRQQRFLSTDARELTRADVTEAVTLGESDLLRAFHRLPGVSTRDDYSSELWVRGARWDMTRVTFDGVPLFAPFHTSGQFSGLSADAIGSAVLLPGVRSAAYGDAGAAVLDLQSRAGGGDGQIRGVGELSLLGTGLTLDQRRRDGKAAWMLAARSSYMVEHVPFTRGLLTEEPGYRFGDVIARADLALPHGARLEASALVSSDVVSPPAVDSASEPATYFWRQLSQRPRSDNKAARVTLFSGTGDLAWRHDVGLGAYDGRLHANRFVSLCLAFEYCESYGSNAWPTGLPSRSALRYGALSGEMTSNAAGAPGVSRWRAGYGVTVQRARFDGFVEATTYDDSTGRRLSDASSLAVATLWGERRWQASPRLLAVGGMRVDASEPLANAGAVRPMPRVELRWAVDSQTTLSAALGRSWQYAQGMGMWDSRSGDRSETMDGSVVRWLLAGRETPAARADLLTVGAEHWIGAGVLAGVNAYARASDGLLLTDRRPGETTLRHTLVGGSERAKGIELSLRRLTGRVTGSAGYTLARATTEASGLRFPSSQDRLSSFDATAMWRAWRGLRLGAAYATQTGAPFSRVATSAIVWDSVAEVGRIDGPSTQERPNVRRAAEYRSLDLLADWGFAVRSVRLDTFLQLRNALLRDNDATYIGSFGPCNERSRHCRDGDYFRDGVYAGYQLGVRVRF